MPRKKLKIKFDFKSFANYIGTILLSTVIFASILISLPLTERYLDNLAYNLNTKEYWSKEYTLLLETTDDQVAENVRNIIYKRLTKFGVEDISTYKKYTEDEKRIVIDIQTSKNQETVEELIRNPFQYQIVTRKEDVDFESEENQYAYLLADNYEVTDWDYNDFRTVYITRLQDSTGEYSYFALFKPWIKDQKGFENFLISHEGEYIGVNIDGYVTPYYVQSGNENTFAVQLTTEDKEQLKAIELLYNSGTVKSSYALEEEKDLEVSVIETDYIGLSIGILIAILITYGFLYWNDNSPNKIVTESLVSTIITFAFYLTYLKIFRIPVDPFILAIESIFIIILNRIMSDNKESHTTLLIILGGYALSILIGGVGYMKTLGKDILILLVSAFVITHLARIYINMVKKVLKK